MSDGEKARYLIEKTEFMVLSTADADGKPWISPVAFSHDEQNRLYWVSAKEAQHSRNVRGRKEIAVAIFGPLPDGEVDGVYFDADARELEDEAELTLAMEVMRKRPQADKFKVKTLADVRGDACWRAYVAIPKEISKAVFDAFDQATGQAITVRRSVEL